MQKATEGFDPVTASADGPLLVKFSAPWCGPCKALGPVLEAAATELSLPVFEVDIEALPDLTGKYRVRGVPTTMLFMNGKVMGSMVGAGDREKVLRFIDESLSLV